METKEITQTEILREICNQIKLLREEVAGTTRPTVSTAEACKILQIVDARPLTIWHGQGLLNRYGAQRSGFKYLRSEILVLQGKLLTGEISIPKRNP